MSENKIIKCAKCQNNAETDSRFRNEYTTTYPIRDKDGKIYCWDCYKNFSRCKGCQKSVANIKFPRSGQPAYPHCNGGVSYNCERISNKVEFICSKKCAEDIDNKRYQEWKDKLNQGWTKCEKCIDLVNWVKEILKGHKAEKRWEEEKTQSWLIWLVRPGAGKLCDNCEHHEKVEKLRQAEIKAQAQKHWDTLPYETRLKEVIRSGSVGWGKKFIGLTAEQIAAQNEVPRGIVYEFELKDCHHDCQDCHLDKDFKNSGGDNNFASSTSENANNEIEEKKEQLRKLKEQGVNSVEVVKLEQEIQELLRKQSENNFSAEKPSRKNDLTPWIIGSVSLVALLGIIIVIVKTQRKKSKIK